ncbi:uncharacterized protein LOC134553037 [Prinia subflava]|uniref:uncharacterized protein LOC134553037 n=1 Tax=Prinia subflava TaxID=208062 RepID=UPI002FDF34F8
MAPLCCSLLPPPYFGKCLLQLHLPRPFNLDDPYIHHTSLQYNCLHDPHLRDYHKRKDILRMLKRRGFITSDNKVLCTPKEFNEYRHYLTRIKLEAENILRQQEESKETSLKSGRLRRGKIALDKGQTSRAELGQEDASTAADSQRKPDSTAAEAQKLQEVVEAIVYKVFARLKVPRHLRATFLRNAAQGIRESTFRKCMRTQPAGTPLDHRQEIEMTAKELLAMVLESLGDHLESKDSEPGRAAQWKEKPVDGGAIQADKSKEADTACSDKARIQAALDNLTIQVVKNVNCLLKSMIASQFEGDSTCECTEILECPKGKVSNRQMQPGFPGASKQQSQEASMRLKLSPLGPELHAEEAGYAEAMEPEDPEMVEESLVREGSPTTSDNTSDTRTVAKEAQSVLGRICKCLPVPPPEEDFQ